MEKKDVWRVFSAFLAVIICLSLLPTAAFAAGDEAAVLTETAEIEGALSDEPDRVGAEPEAGEKESEAEASEAMEPAEDTEESSPDANDTPEAAEESAPADKAGFEDVDTAPVIDGAAGRWVYEDGWYYYIDTGKVIGLQEIEGSVYYFDPGTGKAQSGWFTIGDKVYYFDSNNFRALTGLYRFGSNYYFFNELTGQLEKGLVTSIDGHKYYINDDGIVQTGWWLIGGDTYYFGAYSKYALTGLWNIGGKNYFFDETTGVLGSGLMTDSEGHSYYVGDDGIVQTGWKTVGDKTYYFGAYSKYALTGLWSLGGSTYYFDEVTGEVPEAGLVIASDGHRYFVGEDGRVQTGWRTVDGKTYYFGAYSKYALTGAWNIGGRKYFFDTVTGEVPEPGLLVAADGHRYYIGDDGSVQTGWKNVDGKQYYFSTKSSYALTGLCSLSSGTYYFDDVTGELPEEGLAIASDGHRYYVGEDGRVKTGWKTVDGKTYYFGVYSKYALTGVWSLGSKTYYFDDVTGVLPDPGWATDSDGLRYYIGEDGSVSVGWKTIDGKTYYFGRSSKRALTGLWQIGSTYYFFDDKTGELGSGLVQASDGHRYLLDKDGVVQTGWWIIGDDTYYFGANSKYALTGVWTLGGKTYYFDDTTGILAKEGWATDKDGNRFYVGGDGTVVTGWWTIGGDLYYFGASSKKALTGFWTLSGNNYYFDEETGALVTGYGQYTAKDGSVYYLDGNNAKTGWVTDENGYRYYYGSSTGKMFVGWRIINGYTYYFYDHEDDGIYGSMAIGTKIGDYEIDVYGHANMNADDRMKLFAQNYDSPTDYLILVDTTNCRVGVFNRTDDGWEVENIWGCICGDSSKPTPTGLFSVHAHVYCFGSAYYTCYYGTAFYTIKGVSQYLFHSVLYDPYTGRSKGNQVMGMHVSNGCIRLPWDACKWIYYNIPNDTTVFSY